MFRTVVSVIIMVAASIGGMFFGALFNNAIGGMILFALISGIACSGLHPRQPSKPSSQYTSHRPHGYDPGKR